MGWEITPCQLWMVKPDRKYKSNRRATSKLTLINSWYLVRPLHVFLLYVFCGLLIVHRGNWAENLWHFLPPPVPLIRSRLKFANPHYHKSMTFYENNSNPHLKCRCDSSSFSKHEFQYSRTWGRIFLFLLFIFSTARSSDIVRIAHAPPRESSSVSWVLADLAYSPAPCRCPHRTEKQHFDSLHLFVPANSNCFVL